MAFQPNVDVTANANLSSALRLYADMIEALNAIEQQKLMHHFQTAMVAPMPTNVSPILLAEAINGLLLSQAKAPPSPFTLALATMNQNQPVSVSQSTIASTISNSLLNQTQQVQGILNNFNRHPHPSVSLSTSSPTSSLTSSSTASMSSDDSQRAMQGSRTTTCNDGPSSGGIALIAPEKGAKRSLSATNNQDTASRKRQRSIDYEKDASFLHYHDDKWNFHFNELVVYKDKFGHCNVPYGFEENKALSRWVKRQRYQYKQKMEGKASAMPDGRIRKLDRVGFVWGAQELLWQTRCHELKDYKLKNGHCNVPYINDPNPKLAIWVKCQRRQYKLLQEAKPSNMNAQRIRVLNELGFVWTQRKPTS